MTAAESRLVQRSTAFVCVRIRLILTHQVCVNVYSADHRMRLRPGLCGLHSRGCISCPINYKNLNQSSLMEMRGAMWECFSVCLEGPSHLSVNTFSRVTDQTSWSGREQRVHRGLTRITTEVSHTPAAKANNRLFVCVRVWYVLGQGARWVALMLSGTIYLRSDGNRLQVISLRKANMYRYESWKRAEIGL